MSGSVVDHRSEASARAPASERRARLGAALLCSAIVAALLALQFPGFWSFTRVPAEPDVTAIEVASRLWLLKTDGAATGVLPNSHLGSPVWALPVAGLLFPTTWLGAVLPWNVAFVLAWFLQASLFVAGWMWALRALQHAWPAAIMSGVLVLASGPVWSFHDVGAMDLASICLSGWVVVAVRSWCAAPSARRASRVGLLVFLVFVAGDPLMVPVVVCVAACLCWPHRPHVRMLAGGIGVAASVALGLLSPLLREAQAFFPLSERGPALPLSLYERMGFSTPPARLLELVWSGFRFTEEEARRVNAGAMNAHDFWYSALTIGVVALTLAAWGTRIAARNRSSVVALALLGALLAGLTLGRWSSAALWVWDHVPPFTAWRFPERLWRSVLVCGLPLMALALDGLATTRRTWMAWGLAGVGLVELLSQTPTPQLMDALAAPPEFAALEGAARRHEVRVGVNHQNDPSAPRLRFDTRIFGLPMVQPPDSVGSPVLKFFPPDAWPNHFSLQWLGVSHLIMPAAPQRADVDARLGLGATTPLGDSGHALREVLSSGPHLGLLITRARPGVPFDRLILEPPTSTPEGAVAVDVPRVAWEPFADVLAHAEVLVDPRWMLVGGALAEAQLPPLPSSPGGCPASSSVPLELAVNAARIQARANSSCASVFSVPWRFLQGWHAEVDGAPAAIVAVNALTLGVVLPPGAHDVVFTWHPPGARAAPLALVTLAFVLVVQLLPRRARRA